MTHDCPTIPCQRCNGTRRQPMPAVLHETLTAIKELGKPSMVEIHAHISKGKPVDRKRCPTAVNRRVERLIGLKLVKQVSSRKPISTKLNPPRFRVV